MSVENNMLNIVSTLPNKQKMFISRSIQLRRSLTVAINQSHKHIVQRTSGFARKQTQDVMHYCKSPATFPALYLVTKQ